MVDTQEVARLRALDRYRILDTPAEAGFDDIVHLACQICDAPVALVSLVAKDRQWFKARVGFDPCETPMDQSVCQHGLHEPGLLIIPDLSLDPRTRNNPLVRGDPHLGFYAGARLETPDGHPLGMLCVLDAAPRPSGLTSAQAAALEALARQVMTQMELRRVADLAQRTGTELRELAQSLERQVEERTRERNRLWASTSDLMGSAGLDGYLKEINPAWERALGWNGATLMTQPFAALIDPADHADTRRVLERLARGETVTGFVNRLRTQTGATRFVMWDAVPDRDIVYVVGRDITQQRDTEERLRQAQKMEAVGQLTGGIAHDFNNLLTGISGSLDLLATRVRQGRVAELDRYVEAAQAASKRAAALTHRLLAFSRQQTLDPKPTDVAKLVTGMADLIGRSVGPAIAVETKATTGLRTALVDAHQLENAILNLAINARDAMPDGGRLTIETGARWLDARTAEAREVPPGHYLTVCVSDTGTGMPPEVVARAFDPFFTTKPLGQGTGLGLSMIYGFARQSGGQVRISSEVGQGTVVCIDLPQHAEPEAATEPPLDRGGIAPARPGETVLIVDDEATIRMLVTDVLTDLGYQAIEAQDGAEALAVLRSERRLDLLITDVGLPGGMNGREVADAARELRRGLKVLFITGYAENAALGNRQTEPGMAVLTKPFAMDDLAGKIRALLAA